VGQFNGLTNEGSITLANGATTEITFDNKGLSGTVDFDWKVAFDAEHGGSDPKMRESDLINLPFSLDLPLVLGPIPFKLSFKTAFAFQPTFTSKVTVAQGSYHASYGGDLPMTATADASASGSTPGGGPLPRRHRRVRLQRTEPPAVPPAPARSIPTAARSRSRP